MLTEQACLHHFAGAMAAVYLNKKIKPEIFAYIDTTREQRLSQVFSEGSRYYHMHMP